jgi:hypothetical protein
LEIARRRGWNWKATRVEIEGDGVWK